MPTKTHSKIKGISIPVSRALKNLLRIFLFSPQNSDLLKIHNCFIKITKAVSKNIMLKTY